MTDISEWTIYTDDELYISQRYPDEVMIRLYKDFVSPENLVKVARDFLTRNKGFYLGAWSDGETFGYSRLELHAFIRATEWGDTLHFFPIPHASDEENSSCLDLAVLDDYLARHHCGRTREAS